MDRGDETVEVVGDEDIAATPSFCRMRLAALDAALAVGTVRSTFHLLNDADEIFGWLTGKDRPTPSSRD